MPVEGVNGILNVESAALHAPQVGVANTNPQHAFSVGSNLYIDTESSNVLTVDGNVVCEGVKVGLIEIIPSYDFAAVSNVGNVTQSTIQFSNATTGFVTTANIEVGTANLFVDTVNSRVGIGTTEPVSGLTVSKDIESTNSFITERVLFKETWPNGHNSLIGDLGTWVITNLNQQSNPNITTTPDGYTLVSIIGDSLANGEFVSPAFDLSDYALSDGVLPATDKRRTTTRVFLKCWFGTRNLGASGEVAQVQFSPDNGSTWYTVATSQDTVNDSENERFTMVSADLSPYILETSTNAKIRFYIPWTVGGGDYMRIGRIWIHESDVPTNLGGMWLGAGGNIGIGTTNPVGVNGAGRLEGSSSTGFEYIATRDESIADEGDFIGAYLFKNTDTSGSPPHYAGMSAKHGGTTGEMDLHFYSGRVNYESDTPHMSIVDGNVGIGTTNPLGKLYIAADYNHTLQRPSTNSNHYLVLSKTGAQVVNEGPGISFCGSYNDSNDYQDVMAEIRGVCDTDGGRRGRLEFWTSSSDGINDVDKQAMTIKNDGNVGIGLTNPGTIGSTTYPNVTPILHLMGPIYQTESNDNETWSIGVALNDYYFKVSVNGTPLTNVARIVYSTGVYVDMVTFTGQHRAAHINDIPPNRCIDYEGLIVSADRNQYESVNGDKSRGIKAITVNEAVPLLSLSKVAYDKKCFGVISGSEDPDTRTQSFGNLKTYHYKEPGDTFIFTNSVGEGAIWVVNTNGSLESGDYITTSNVAGYGQRQDSEFLANYTVAKITMDCDFEPVTQPIQVIKREMGNVDYWIKKTITNVSSDDYSKLADEYRATDTEIYYSNETDEITVEKYNTLEPGVQSTYTELNRTIYQEINIVTSKKNEDGHDILEVRQEMVNVLDEHGQIQWEDHPTETEKVYKIRYLDADGVETDEANHVHKAAFVGCTYHCG